MIWLLLFTLVCLLLAAAVAVYVAYPRRGEEVPHAPWLGDAMRRGVASLPTIDNGPRRTTESPIQPLVQRVRELVGR